MLDFRERRVEFPKEAKMDELSSLRAGGLPKAGTKGRRAAGANFKQAPRSGDFFRNEDAKQSIYYCKLSFGGGSKTIKGLRFIKSTRPPPNPCAWYCAPRFSKIGPLSLRFSKFL